MIDDIGFAWLSVSLSPSAMKVLSAVHGDWKVRGKEWSHNILIMTSIFIFKKRKEKQLLTEKSTFFIFKNVRIKLIYENLCQLSDVGDKDFFAWA